MKKKRKSIMETEWEQKKYRNKKPPLVYFRVIIYIEPID